MAVASGTLQIPWSEATTAQLPQLTIAADNVVGAWGFPLAASLALSLYLRWRNNAALVDKIPDRHKDTLEAVCNIWSEEFDYVQKGLETLKAKPSQR